MTDEMDIIVHGITPVAVTTKGDRGQDGLSSRASVGKRGGGRYSVDISQLEGVSICWTDEVDEKLHARVDVKLKPGRKIRRRGWERLRIVPLCAGSEGLFSAYQIYREEEGRRRTSVLIYRRPDRADFMSDIPDHTPLGEIAMPGTHESCALYGYPISQCQQPSTPIVQQLLDGVRFLDVRLRVVGDQLLMYHGPRPQRSSLAILITALNAFLLSHPTETLILSLKEESPPWHPHFSSLVYSAFTPYLDRFWFLEERIPALGEVRGKGLLMTRFEKNEGDDGWKGGMGIHPSRWPDSRSEGFEWNCAGTRVRTQDWYRVKTFLSIPEKFDALVSHLSPTTRPPTEPTFTLSYTSASYFPLSCPTTIAKGFGFPSWGFGVEGMNSRFTRWLLRLIAEGKRVSACVPMDFYRQDGWAAELLILMNVLNEDGGREKAGEGQPKRP